MKNDNIRLDLHEILGDFYDLYAYINGKFVKGVHVYLRSGRKLQSSVRVI